MMTSLWVTCAGKLIIQSINWYKLCLILNMSGNSNIDSNIWCEYDSHTETINDVYKHFAFLQLF